MSENTNPETEDINVEEAAEAAARKAMADLMADSTKRLTNYLRLTAARITAERELEELAKEQWVAWRDLTSSTKGGFTEAQLKRQAITGPAPVPRRDRGKKKNATRKTASAAAVVGVEQTHEPQGTDGQNNEPYGG